MESQKLHDEIELVKTVRIEHQKGIKNQFKAGQLDQQMQIPPAAHAG